MAKKQRAGHVHKLMMRKYPSGFKVFFCVDGTCPYRIESQLALEKESICWVCGNKFNLNVIDIKTVRPRCNDCKRTKELKFVNQIARGIREEKPKEKEPEVPFSKNPKLADENELEAMLKSLVAPVTKIDQTTMADDDEL